MTTNCFKCRESLKGKNRIRVLWFRRSRKYPNKPYERNIKGDKTSVWLCETCADTKSPNLWIATKMGTI